VYNNLGAGFLEKVYEKAMEIELRKQGLVAVTQFPIKVYYDNNIIGDYFADILVENCIIVELKAINEISKVHETQLVNYLKATGLKVGLIINFGDTISIKRKVLQSKEDQKKYK
jgi:GxxExxY protein